MHGPLPRILPLLLLTILLFGQTASAEDPLLAGSDWIRNDLTTVRYEIRGTGDRNNPLRRRLPVPFDGDELYVRYRLRYDAATIDQPADGDGEFLVFWLDDIDGGQTATHSAGVPNLGIHVSGDANRFMARYSASQQNFAATLQGDQDYCIVGRLSKSVPGPQQPFDRLALWIDPGPEDLDSPGATAEHRKAISRVEWIGFATGRKTEPGDRITIHDVALSTTWRGILGLPAIVTPEPITPPEPTVAFTEDVLPILQTRCFDCHSGEDATEGVRLDILDEVLNRTSPRDAKSSHLYQLVSKGEMPPDEDRLPAEELAVLKAWIDEGLAWDEKLLPTPVPTTDHWAFQPIRRPDIPEVQNRDWIRTPVDAFIARKHEEAGIQPAPPADPQTLARRLSLDMLGLPAIPDQESKSWEEQIEQTFSNPAYGERWGRHWLDLARWAESNGHQHNRHRPHAWRYRDWVVNAFNSNKPYDEFLREQIAGDELTPYRDENIVATGFLAAARYSGNELDKQIQRNDILVDIVNTTGRTFLGLTFECAQCHTHKFDPISIRDYYRLQAFFATGQPENVVAAQHTAAARPLIEERWQIFDSTHARLVDNKRRQGHPEPIYVIPKSVVSGMKPDDRKRFQELERQIGQLTQTWAFHAPGTAGSPLVLAPIDMRWPLSRDTEQLSTRSTMLLIRGDVMSPGPEVRPGWPAVFGPSPAEFAKPRTALADWMTSPDNPLTARVWVNRIWQWHFGRGLVETSGDFGKQGTPPSHPELLDYLASELISSGWDTQHIHRLILNSATWRQSHRHSPAAAKIDPDNRLLWRWTPRRLEAEAIRDSILAVSGMLDDHRGGPSVPADKSRRSLYLLQRRDNLPHQQMLFDGANGLSSCSRRRVSTTPLQPLWLMNSRFVQQAAERFAAHAGDVDRAIRLAFGRAPRPDETKLLQDLAAEHGLPSACLAILNSSEFLYLP